MISKLALVALLGLVALSLATDAPKEEAAGASPGPATDEKRASEKPPQKEELEKKETSANPIGDSTTTRTRKEKPDGGPGQKPGAPEEQSGPKENEAAKAEESSNEENSNHWTPVAFGAIAVVVSRML